MMDFLSGEYERKLDQKNRLAIPTKLRDLLSLKDPDLKGVYVTPGQDRSLAIYTPDKIGKVAEQLDRAPFTREKVRHFRRLYFALAEFCEWDGQGRILIPERLVTWAGLKKQVMLVGVQDHMEIWDRERWTTFISENAAKFDAIAEGAFEELL